MPHPVPRDIVFNSWEGVRFDLSEARLASLMDDARALGAECFVVDDGWFGRGRFARNDDAHGLGDWKEDRAKFPHGLARVAQEAKCPGLTPGDRPLTPDERAAVRDAGLGFRVYGVNSPEALAEAARLGAAAFTCNYWRQAFDWARALGGIELLA